MAITDERRSPARAPGVTRRGRRPRWRRWALRLVAALVGVILIAAACLAAVIAVSPSVANAPQLVRGRLAAHHAPSDHGVIPPKVGAALLATEDSRYYRDPALDPQGTVRAVIGLVTGNSNEGGATIEVQLAKMLYTHGSSIGAQLLEVGVAFRLDARFTKKRILALYLDAAYFGDGAYGVTAAAEHYFGRPPGQLSWAQASLLAGLVQAPSAYNPHGHFTLARQRQAHVLSRLVATHQLSALQAAQVWKAPLDPVIRFYG